MSIFCLLRLKQDRYFQFAVMGDIIDLYVLYQSFIDAPSTVR